jgi:hypothetical protein
MNSVGKDFYDGVYEIYQEIYTEEISISLLDTVNTVVDEVYHESDNKVYLPPILLLGKVAEGDFKESDIPIEQVKFNMLFTVPTKEMEVKKVPFITDEEISNLKKAKFTYNGVKYIVQYIAPTTRIGGTYLTFKFYCLKEPIKRGA